MQQLNVTTPAQALEGATRLPRLADVGRVNAGALISPPVLIGLVRMAELAAICATGFLIAAVYVAEADLAASWQYMIAPFATACATFILFQTLGLYTVAAFSTVVSQLGRMFVGWTGALAVLVTGVFFLKSGADFSRVWLVLWFVVGLGTIIAVRMAVQRLTLRALADGRLARRAVVYGSGLQAEQLLASLEADATSDVRISGIFDDRDAERAGAGVAGYPNLGDTDALVDFCRSNRVELVLVALPLAAEARIASLMRHIHVLPADVRIAAGATSLRFSAKAYSYVGNVPMLSLSDRPISDWGQIAKSAFDRIVAAVVLVLAAPIMAAVALAVRFESKGPILFRQKRYGFNNELIEVYKFRSMYTDRCDAAAVKLVTKDDPRVTRVGRIIRKSSLDELPQLFNVLTGTLSLVGPRPHAVQAKAADKLYPDVVDGYFARHKVKPGITGWAQINGWRGETDTQEKIQRRVEHDLYYIENWSLLLDILILLKTPGSLLAKRDNAY